MISQSKNVQWYKNIHFNRVFSHFCFSYSWASGVFETFWRLAKWFRKNKCFEQKFAILIIKFGYRKSSSVSSLRCLKQDICLYNGDSPLLSLFITLSERGRLCEEAKMMPCSTRLRERESWLPCVFASGIQDEKFDFLNYHFSYFHF